MLEDQVGPLLAGPAVNFCFDSPNFPDNSSEIGTNSCAALRRDAAFNFTNGFVLPFFNLPSTQIRALSVEFDYAKDVADVAGLFMDSAGADFGRLTWNSRVYFLKDYISSASGQFDDSIRTDGTFARPSFEVLATAAWNYEDFRVGWTWAYSSATTILNSGTPITIENQPILGRPAVSTHTLSMRYNFEEKYTAQINLTNVFDKNFIDEETREFGGAIDFIGRSILFTLSATF